MQKSLELLQDVRSLAFQCVASVSTSPNSHEVWECDTVWCFICHLLSDFYLRFFRVHMKSNSKWIWFWHRFFHYFCNSTHGFAVFLLKNSPEITEDWRIVCHPTNRLNDTIIGCGHPPSIYARAGETLFGRIKRWDHVFVFLWFVSFSEILRRAQKCRLVWIRCGGHIQSDMEHVILLPKNGIIAFVIRWMLAWFARCDHVQDTKHAAWAAMRYIRQVNCIKWILLSDSFISFAAANIAFAFRFFFCVSEGKLSIRVFFWNQLQNEISSMWDGIIAFSFVLFFIQETSEHFTFTF